MPAYADRRRTVRPRERVYALAAVAVVQGAIGVALLLGLRVEMTRPADVVQRLVDVSLAKPPPPPQVEPASRPQQHQAAAPKTKPDKLGGSPGPRPAHAPPSVTPIIALQPSAPPS